MIQQLWRLQQMFHYLLGDTFRLTEETGAGMVHSVQSAREDTMMQYTIEIPDDIAEQMLF